MAEAGASRMQEMFQRTLAEHGAAIASLTTEVKGLHSDSKELKEGMAWIKSTLTENQAKQEAKKPMGAATLLGMCLSAMLCASLTFGALRFFIHSEIDRQNELLQYRLAVIERSISWQPTLVASNGHALQVGGH